jgi:5-methyltetrahydrofolate--homocysteine methyltransferase
MITIIGNSLNSGNKKVLDKMNKMDVEYIRREVQHQLESGAEYIELNAMPLLHHERPFLRKVIPIVEELGAKVFVRSDNTDTLVEAIEISQNDIIVGDIEFNPEKIEVLCKAMQVSGKTVRIVALTREDSRDNEIYPEKSLLIAQKYVDTLLDKGISRKNILLDPVIQPLEENFSHGKTFLNTLELFKLDFPQVKTIGNLTNLSCGLPRRFMLTSYFLSLAISRGLDYIVLNVMDKSVQEATISTLSIIGRDRNLQNYLKFCRNKKETRQRQL